VGDWDRRFPAEEGSEMARRSRSKPRDLSLWWPDVESMDRHGEVGRRYALRLAIRDRGRSVRSVAPDAGLDEGTLGRCLRGSLGRI
jgi:hypothetical protein